MNSIKRCTFGNCIKIVHKNGYCRDHTPVETKQEKTEDMIKIEDVDESKMATEEKLEECPICYFEKTDFHNLCCCNQKICKECLKQLKNDKCPYCVKELTEENIGKELKEEIKNKREKELAEMSAGFNIHEFLNSENNMMPVMRLVFSSFHRIATNNGQGNASINSDNIPNHIPINQGFYNINNAQPEMTPGLVLFSLLMSSNLQNEEEEEDYSDMPELDHD